MSKKAFKKTLSLVVASVVILGLLVGCTHQPSTTEHSNNEKGSQANSTLAKDFKYEVVPETFSLNLISEGTSIPVSQEATPMKVENFIEKDNITTWTYPDAGVNVEIQPRNQYLEVNITSTIEDDNSFDWPMIEGETYFIPFGEGKKIPSNDTTWNNYLSSNEFGALEQLSMPFWAVTQGELSVLYVMENPFRSSLNFDNKDHISFAVNHKYPQIGKFKKNTFRIYLTNNDPTSVAKLYKDYVKEKGNFVTLEEKASDNPNIRKLYGAPHIYLAGDLVISDKDINWIKFRKALDSDIMKYLLTYSEDIETGNEMLNVIKDLKNQDYVAMYQKNIICNYLSDLIRYNNFYKDDILKAQNSATKDLLSLSDLKDSSLIELNKQLLYENMQGVFNEPKTWMNSQTVDLISDMKKSGIDTAWIGLHNWEQAYSKPELTILTTENGYLIGPYDSYHSIHEPGKEQWITAKFHDISLYETATVTKKNSEKVSGFNNIGRKLNPTLSLPSVNDRINEILSNPLNFNTWFIDCDATGEIYDDYSKDHLTTEEQDLNARLIRMEHIRDKYNMVIGSEGGHDFAASTIAFAHGIELKSFSWMDDDMKGNKNSDYYMGKYFSATGGVPEHFAKRIPIKDHLYTLFVDPRYDIPLFKLVYNDSVITTYHWDWSTFKINGATKDRMLREVLYNVPPLYHIDGDKWYEYSEDIVKHTTAWSDFSKKAITKEMTLFKNLNENGSVQMTRYGKDLTVVANFENQSFEYEGQVIPAKSALIQSVDTTYIYTPSVEPEHE